MNFNFQSELTNIANRYVADWFNIKNEKETKELALKLLNGYKFCTSCFAISSRIYKVPDTLYFSAKQSFFYNPGEVCKNCLRSIAKTYKVLKDEENKVSQGHLRVDVRLPDKRNKNGGFTYICQRNNTLYKIGASTNLRSRMYGQKFNKNDFICAIHSTNPFELEKYLHNLYENKRPNKHEEFFILSTEDLEYIKSIKSINDIPVLCYTSFSVALKQKPQT